MFSKNRLGNFVQITDHLRKRTDSPSSPLKHIGLIKYSISVKMSTVKQVLPVYPLVPAVGVVRVLLRAESEGQVTHWTNGQGVPKGYPPTTTYSLGK